MVTDAVRDTEVTGGLHDRRARAVRGEATREDDEEDSVGEGVSGSLGGRGDRHTKIPVRRVVRRDEYGGRRRDCDTRVRR